MHTVRRVYSKPLHKWRVDFDAGAETTNEEICRFSNYRDAHALCNYLNGGVELRLTPKGFEEYGEWHAQPTYEMED